MRRQSSSTWEVCTQGKKNKYKKKMMVCQARTGWDESDGSSVCISEQRRPEAELAVAADKV